MTDLVDAADKLIDLIEGRYSEILFNRRGMEEYDDYEEKYLGLFSSEDKVLIFCNAYNRLDINNIEESVKQIFYLASVYGVKFSNAYFDLLEREVNEEKKRIFFTKMRYYIEDRWSDSQKESLTPHQKILLKRYCSQYNLDLPYNI